MGTREGEEKVEANCNKRRKLIINFKKTKKRKKLTG